MSLKLFRILLILFSFIFLTGFLPFTSLLGPSVTIVSSGKVYKAGAQILIDQSIKKKTGKNSLDLVREEVNKQNSKKNFDEEFRKLVEKRIMLSHKKLKLKINQ